MWRTRFGGSGTRFDGGIDGDEALGEGLDEGRLVGPLLDEGDVEAVGDGHEGAAVKADAGARVLRREADGDDARDAVGTHPADHVFDVRVPVAHARVDRQRMTGSGERGFERAGLREGPAGERRRFNSGLVAETNLGVAVLEFFHHFMREGATSGDLGEVLGHLAEDVWGSVGEEQDGGVAGLRHAWIILYWTPSPRT